MKKPIKNITLEDVMRMALGRARKALAAQTFGVGGLILDARSGEVIHMTQNAVMEGQRLKDPTAHLERRLIDWYYAHKEALKLPEPDGIILISSLDPCCMCAGSIVVAGFKTVVAAFDDMGGINYDRSCNFLPLEGLERERLERLAYYPSLSRSGAAVSQGHGQAPACFSDAKLSEKTFKDCLEAYKQGLDLVQRAMASDDYSIEPDFDPKASAPKEILNALKKIYPKALTYAAPTPGRPDEKLAAYLLEAAERDRQNGGTGDAVAFLDAFGNLLLCLPGNKKASPIKTAYMSVIQAYSKLRHSLAQEFRNYLCAPSRGCFVFLKGFDQSASSLIDLGAYASTIAVPVAPAANLQYCLPRMEHVDLLSHISRMPPFYHQRIRPVQVQCAGLIKALTEVC